jgi:hypothetical protein
VRRVVGYIDPRSVLKVSVLLYLVLFLVVCVASVVLWAVGRQTGAVDNVEDFITELGAFGRCEPIDGRGPASAGGDLPAAIPGATRGTIPGAVPEPERDEYGCLPGERFVGGFEFADGQLLGAFVLLGLVMVVAGSALNVVLVVIFNQISDLTGGVRVIVLEEEPRMRSDGPVGADRPVGADGTATGSPGPA